MRNSYHKIVRRPPPMIPTETFTEAETRPVKDSDNLWECSTAFAMAAIDDKFMGEMHCSIALLTREKRELHQSHGSPHKSGNKATQMQR